MKHSYIKEQLINKGFKPYGSQANLLHYIHPNIETNNYAITLEFRDDTDTDLMTENEFNNWLLNIDITSINFSIDVGISYHTQKSKRQAYCNLYENTITIYDEDIHMFDYILNLICDPFSQINFYEEYDKHKKLFLSNIKKFIPSLKKHNITIISSHPTNGYGLYPSICVTCKPNNKHNKSNYIDFYMDVLTWNQYIILGLTETYTNNNRDNNILDMDCDINDFNNILEKQVDLYNLYLLKVKNQYDINSKTHDVITSALNI